MTAFAAARCPGNGGEEDEDPFDSSPIDSDDEPDLFPPDPHENWVDLKRVALLAGELEMAGKIIAPVLYHGSKQCNPRWEALSFQEVKELRWTVTIHSIESPYFESLLSSTLSAHLMTPHDIGSLAGLILTSTQCTLWEAEWKKGLQALILTYVGHRNRDLAALTLDHLVGEQPYTDPSDQDGECPQEAHEGVRGAARKVFLKVPDAGMPQKIFTSIIQEAQEPHMQFIDRLKQALEQQTDNEPAPERLLLKPTVENANGDCKKLLKSLTNPNPTLVEMIEACNHLGTQEHTSETLQTLTEGIACF